MKIIEILALIILCPLPALIGYNLGRQSSSEYLKQTEEAIAVAEKWEAVQKETAKTRDEAIALAKEWGEKYDSQKRNTEWLMKNFTFTPIEKKL